MHSGIPNLVGSRTGLSGEVTLISYVLLLALGSQSHSACSALFPRFSMLAALVPSPLPDELILSVCNCREKILPGPILLSLQETRLEPLLAS